jgi:sensor histidine kinase YesM
VSLSQDLDFIKTYISLQQIRLPDNINVITSIQDHIESSLSIEPMVLISFIENAFKHGITTKEKSDIIVNITVEGKSLKLLVQNGNWSKKELYKGNNSGIGISNTTQRLEHSYRNKYTLDISDKDNIHTVYLTLNLDS